MIDPELPPDLAALERRLADRPRAGPSPDLAARVLAASRDALRRPAVPAVGWRPWATVAAVVLFGINLSMSLSANTDWHFTADVEPGQVDATADRLRELAPGLPE